MIKSSRVIERKAGKHARNWNLFQQTPRPPSTAPASEVSAIRRQVRELRSAIAAERRRVEDLLATGRRWALADWRRYYLDHPVTGRIGKQLIWTFATGATALTGIPGDPGTLRTLSGDAPLPGTATVRLWHPATAEVAEVAAWRGWLLDRQLVQPVRQAFREIYLITPAELETGTYSNRFAGHIVAFRQLYALFRERGWTAGYLGPHDGGDDGRARRDLPGTGLTVVFEYHRAGGDRDAAEAELAGTDRVWFFHSGDRARRPVPLRDIPVLALSEAMRDADLFVSVSSIALDPMWSGRDGDPHYGYWREASTGELGAVGQLRRDVLARILPGLAIADRVELSGRYVRVRGSRATYKVHIGSAGVFTDPGDRYLCIVARGGSPAGRVMLPFEEDSLLSLILSKVFLLANDDKITDASILGQIGDPRR